MQLSVIIAARNAGDYLREAIESVFVQAVESVEILVVDDGSTDDTAAVAESFGEPVKLLRQAATGNSYATNTGVENSRGTYLAFLDADDVWLPGKIAAQLHCLETTDASGCFVNFQNFQHPVLSHRGAVMKGLLPSAFCVRRDLWTTVGSLREDLRFGAFVDWLDRAKAKGCVFETIPEVLLLRRAHDQNATRDRTGMAKDYLKVAHQALQRRRAKHDSAKAP